jgi:cell division topological specificity factor
MGILNYFRSTKKSNSASLAKERLQIIVAHQNVGKKHADYLPQLKQDLLKVISKYVEISIDQVQVQLDTDDKNCQVLELNVTLPEQDNKT